MVCVTNNKVSKWMRQSRYSHQLKWTNLIVYSGTSKSIKSPHLISKSKEELNDTANWMILLTYCLLTFNNNKIKQPNKDFLNVPRTFNKIFVLELQDKWPI